MKIFKIITIILISLITASCKNLTDTILIVLPVAYHANYGHAQSLITTQSGCYNWQSSAKEIIAVTGYPKSQANCFRKSLVEVSHTGQYYSSIIIYGKNKQTKQQVSVNIRLKKIIKITIQTNIKIMNIQQIQKLQLSAHDNQDNMFTSLEGLRFIWQLDNNQILNKIKIENSPLFLQTTKRKQLQRQQYQSDILILKALKVGKVKIKVRCIQSNYQLLEDHITIYVQDRFNIIPGGIVYMLADSQYQFKMFSIYEQLISLPQYYYKSTINSDFKIDNTLKLKTPQQQSYTRLLIEDIRTSPSFSVKIQIYSYKPDRIQLIIKQQIIVGRQTKFQVKYYNRNKQLQGYHNGLTIQSVFPIIDKQKVKPTKKMNEKIKIAYGNIVSQKNIFAVLPLKAILPKQQIILPINQSYQLNVIGGSQSYQYTIDNNIAIITFNGTIITKMQGQADIKVTDRKVKQNFIIIKLRVKPIKYIENLQQYKQANLNQQTSLYIIGKDINHQHYTQCNDIHFSIQTDNYNLGIQQSLSKQNQLLKLKQQIKVNKYLQNKLKKLNLLLLNKQNFRQQFKQYLQSGDINQQQLNYSIEKLENYGICSILGFKGNKVLDGKIIVRGQDQFLSSRIYVRVYQSLSSIYFNKNILMTPFSSLQLTTKGGSLSWNDSQTQYYLNNVKIQSKNPILSCPQIPTTLTYSLKYQNKVTQSLIWPVSQQKIIKIICKYPQLLKIQLQKDPTTVQRSRVLLNAIPGTTIKGKVYTTDLQHNKFYNDSNIQYKYQDKGGYLFTKNNNKQFQFTITSNSKIQIKTNSLINKNLIYNYPEIKNQLIISYVHPFSIQKKYQKYYILSNYKQIIAIPLKNASNNIQISVLGDSIDCYYDRYTSTLKNKVNKIGKTSIKIFDSSIYDRNQIYIELQVVNPTKIMLNSNRTQIQQGQQTQIQLQIYYNDHKIDIIQYQQTNLKLIYDNKLVSIIKKQINIFIIHGKQIGKLQIYGQISSPIKLQSINFIQLQIYKKLSLNLKEYKQWKQDNIYYLQAQVRMSVGCNTSISFVGGPQKNIQTKYLINNNNILSLLQLSQKYYKLYGKQKGTNQIKFQIDHLNKLFAIIIIKINIDKINGFDISSLSRVTNSTQFRLIPDMLVDNQKIDNSQCNFFYQWKSSDNNIINIKSSILYLQKNINNLGGINATANNPGTAQIQLIIKQQKSLELIDKVKKSIQVIDITYYQLPRLIGQRYNKFNHVLLIPPNSGYKFPSNYQIKKNQQQQDNNNLLVYDSIQSNLIKTKNQIGLSQIIIQQKQKIPSRLSIQVIKISSLFIQNPYGLINMQLDVQTKIKFYVQDSFGRLFFNNLQKINYRVTVSDPGLVSVKISKDKQYIQLIGKRLGICSLYLSIAGQNIRDVIMVNIGLSLSPSANVYVHTGGRVYYSIQGNKNNINRWYSQDNTIAQISPNTGQTIAKRQGQTNILTNGIIGKINVLKASKISNLYSNIIPQTNIDQFSLKYLVSWNIDGKLVQLTNINNPQSPINNNLQYQCQSTHPNWFQTKAVLSKNPLNQQNQIIQCLIKASQVYPQNQQMPQQLNIFITLWNQKINFRLFESFTYPYHMIFKLSNRDKKIVLNKDKTYTKISVKSNQKLQIMVINGQQNIFKTQYIPNKKIQQIQIFMPDYIKQKKQWKIRLTNPSTRQSQYINVYYQIQTKSSSSIFSNLQWTDYLIIIMAINIIFFYFNQKRNDQDSNKRKIY